ncbi:hypothetical protein [Herpetosiphon geysericola]|uniref:Lipoprotein n=1 Tax=Herpetosiphon geysericola TaxID=70996 RepID=A0A0N8GT36_9CHLR|nr:hypothetical protein [Herpetosiphon geysericola]KPL91002.1 hypothetical protein SE18_04385 [Herpetosiphon geysericola]
MRWLTKLVLLMSLSTFWSGCAQQSERSASMATNDPVTVQLDMTAGMPPPTWQMSATQQSEFFTILQQLTPVEARKAFDNLGNRGFVVTTMNPARTIRVQQGFVWIIGDNYERVFSDQHNDLERFLLLSGQPTLEPALYTMLEKGIGQN